MERLLIAQRAYHNLKVNVLSAAHKASKLALVAAIITRAPTSMTFPIALAARRTLAECALAKIERWVVTGI